VASLSKKPISADTVLYRRKRAPTRNPENDIYFEDRHLDASEGQALPDSDLLKAVHQYASDFYSGLPLAAPPPVKRRRNERGELVAGVPRKPASYDFRSLDGTALIAVGVLLEEMARDALGECGHLVLTEPRGADAGMGDEEEIVPASLSSQPASSDAAEVEESLGDHAPMGRESDPTTGENSPGGSDISDAMRETRRRPRRVRSRERKRVTPTRTWTLDVLRRAKSHDANERGRERSGSNAPG